MGAHALLSASASHRWLVCTPSARLESHFPDAGSSYAEEGTRAHALAEQTLKDFLNGGDGRVSCDDKEMQEAVQRYVDLCAEKISAAWKVSADAKILVEHRLDFSAFVPQGFGTGDLVIVSDGGLEVCDLKYGKGVRVEAEKNSQMMLYALGALHEYGWLYDIGRVRMTIIQPRIDNISSWEISETELLNWGMRVKAIAQKAFAGEGEYKAGPHCRFCRARATCRAYAEAMKAHIVEGLRPGPELEDHEISDILEHSKEIKNWLDGVEAYALGKALSGTKWPGLKLVAGRSTRKIADEAAAAASLMAAGYSGIYRPQSLRTITELEKLCGKKHFAEILGANIQKSEGKPALVPESDKRPEMTVGDFRDDFEGIPLF